MRLLKLLSLVFVAFLMLSITGFLGFRFYLMLYFPGTDETRHLFTDMAPYWDTLGLLSLNLKLPGQYAGDGVAMLWPELSSWLPSISAARFMALMTGQPMETLGKLYPGTAELTALLALPIWNILLAGIYWCLWALIDNRDGLSQINLRTPRFKIPTIQPKGDSPSSQTQSKAAQGRLSRIKDEPQNVLPPHLNRQAMTADEKDVAWRQYTDEQGNLMARQLISDLQRENQQLRTQQQQLRSTFSQYFSPNVARYLEENKATFQQVDNQKRQVSVMFCDIRGFSAYAQQASSQELIAYLDEYFSIASHVILNRHDGVISKLMGDGLMAYWGFPLPEKDHALIAVQAGLLILQEVALRNQTTSHPMQLNVGVSIASGEVVVGNVGSSDFKDFTLIGTPVNLASRLDEVNKQLGESFLISEQTYLALNGRISCRDMGEVDIRGWQGKERVYRPER